MSSDQPKNSENNEALYDIKRKEANAAIEEINSFVESVVSGSLEEESLKNHIKAIQQISLDPQALLNIPNIPKDAGIYKESLEKMLARIPNGWGKWIDCGPGWFPIITELDEKLSAMIPNYEIHQIKEKYGTLRFYWGVPETKLPCCSMLDSKDPHPATSQGFATPGEQTPKELELYDAWLSRRQEHLDSPEHLEQVGLFLKDYDLNKETRRKLGEQAWELVDKAEELSTRVCEDCGDPGSLCEQSGWFRTLCTTCCDKLGYVLYKE